MSVDGIGIVVLHTHGKEPTKQEVRNHLIGWNEQKTILIQAESLEKALEEFYNYAECKTGTKHKAWEIVDSERNPVVEYAGCDQMLNKEGWMACTLYDDPGEEATMCCILDGLDDPPEECPIYMQMEEINYKEELVQISGVWVKRYVAQNWQTELKNKTKGQVSRRREPTFL